MQKLKFYEKELKCKNENDVFSHLLSTLKPSIKLWSYFVNWDKVFDNLKKIELSLNTLNYLIGKDDFDKEFKYLIKKNPEIIEVLPALVVRDGDNTQKFNILVDYKNKVLKYKTIDFSKTNITDNNIENYLSFIEETGFKKLIQDKKIKNLVDYMVGVEAGIDSNGRKNRSGQAMENIVDIFIDDLCAKKSYVYLKGGSTKKVKQCFLHDVPVDKANRIYDFVINTGKELYIIETNFYGGGGSKLKATVGEYKKLHETLKEGKYTFIWITDGMGWKGTHKPLREAFDKLDYIVNLDMLEKGILNEIIK
jgi:type II restriction enzyme